MTNIALKYQSLTLVEKIIAANIVIFAAMLLSDPLHANYRLELLYFLKPSSAVLSAVGVTGYVPVFVDNRWWTLLSANYVHLGGFHLGLNMAMLYSLGRIAVHIYGEQRTLFIYTLGGIFSMYVSSLAKIPQTAGASGALCTLAGAIVFAEWRGGGGSFTDMIRSIGVWIVMLAIIGVLMPNVNNWAHFAGLAAGLPLGGLFWNRRQEYRGQQTGLKVGVIACVVATMGAFALDLF
jgi:rhomboid protease GluP